MKATRRQLFIIAFVLCVAACAAVLVVWHHQISNQHIERFGSDLRGWKPYGGSWELKDGIVRNNSDERGAKLITGSPFAGDYLIEADVAVLGDYGDSGLVVRAQDIERGSDSYKGFYAGLRTLDNAFLLGRADYGWDQYKKGAVAGDILVGKFYHLRLAAVGCAVAARVDLPNGQSVREGVDLAKCVRTGQVGLRSYASPAMWKNFQVAPATMNDVLQLMDGTPLGLNRNGTLHTCGPTQPGCQSNAPIGADPRFNERGPITKEALSRRLEGQITTISSIPLLSTVRDTPLSIHGAVTLISPMTYVEDQTGGIAVLSHDAPALAIGDEVEITGTVVRSSGEFVMRKGHVKTLRSNTLSSPPMITADEAATGTKDGHLVLIDGQLIRTWITQTGQLVLELESRDEVFHAIAEAAHYTSSDEDIRPKSDLQILGVVSSSAQFAGNSAFGLLISPSEDSIRVIHGASWWTPVKTAIVSMTVVCFVFLFITVNHRLRERHLIQASKERELLAHDLHDTVSQSLAGIAFQLSSAAANISKSDVALHQIERARSMVMESHEELRRSITSLRTEIAALDNLGNALKATALRLVGDGPIKVTCSTEGKIDRLPLAMADCFFRVGQEAVSNAVHHAGASRLTIELKHRADRLMLSVSDDGPGFSHADHELGFGIYGMSKRAEMIGARFEVVSGSKGTTVLLDGEVHSRITFHDIAAMWGISKFRSQTNGHSKLGSSLSSTASDAEKVLTKST
jgi:signal transduction histidine kinase